MCVSLVFVLMVVVAIYNMGHACNGMGALGTFGEQEGLRSTVLGLLRLSDDAGGLRFNARFAIMMMDGSFVFSVCGVCVVPFH